MQVCPMFISHAKALLMPLKKLYTRLQPPKDKNGNFTEQPQALYNLALKCWSDIDRIVTANSKYDAAVAAKQPLPDFPDVR